MNICISGASSGIGRALAKHLVADAHTVWGLARREHALSSLQQELGHEHFFYSVCDVDKKEDVSSAIAQMQRNDFMPDVVILGAGVSHCDVEERNINLRLFKSAFGTNVFGAVHVIEAFLPEFLKRRRGHFIALAAMAALRPKLCSISYSASKSALSLAIRGLAIAYRNQHVLFTNVYLGPVNTSMWDGRKSFFVSSPEYAAKKIARVIKIKKIKTKKTEYYFPFLPTLLYRLILPLPDSIYIRLVRFLK
jgi:short-subunit dehydrogenase